MFTAILLMLAPCSEPQFTVENKIGPAPAFKVVNRTQATYDPYHIDTYAKFREQMSRPSGWGVLYVGVPDGSIGSYAPHAVVPSGFLGIENGVYDCKYSPNGPVMEKRQRVEVPASPFPSIPTTPVTGAVHRSSSSSGFYPTDGMYTHAPGVVFRGFTSGGGCLTG